MRLIIAGSRFIELEPPEIAKILLEHNLYLKDLTQIVSGGCRGMDKSGERFAHQVGLNTKVFHAEWNLYGNSAGPRRNRLMARNADALLLVWDGTSRGSARAINAGLKIFEKIIK